jgi:hypothetical protein
LKFGNKALETVKEPEPEITDRTMMVLKLTEALKLSDARIKLFEDIYRNEQRATTAHRIARIPACCEGIQNKKKNKKKKEEVEEEEEE